MPCTRAETPPATLEAPSVMGMFRPSARSVVNPLPRALSGSRRTKSSTGRVPGVEPPKR